MPKFVNLEAGDPGRHFIQRSLANPRYVFSTAAGRYLVMCFFGSAGQPFAQRALKAAHGWTDIFDDRFASFYGVSIDPVDEKEGRIADRYPGYRNFLDFDHQISRLYGAVPIDSQGTGQVTFRGLWVVLDPTMRVQFVLPFEPDGSDIDALKSHLDSLPPPERFAGMELQAPILYLKNVFEPELCDRLIGLYEADGGQESGFMRQIDGKTVAVMDHNHKRRRDYNIEDAALIAELQNRVKRRIVPEIAKVHQFHITRMERYIVACYRAEDQAHFRPHRDNTTAGTAHRRFAVSINLNEDFDGGELTFPEYGPRSFKPAKGAAVVFSCSLLHAVSPVTRGHRYAFLPFLYDDAAAETRRKNNKFLDEKVGQYQG